MVSPDSREALGKLRVPEVPKGTTRGSGTPYFLGYVKLRHGGRKLVQRTVVLYDVTAWDERDKPSAD